MAHAKSRMRALSGQPRFRIADELDIHPARLMAKRGHQEIRLQLRTMETLVELAMHAGETLSRERLLFSVWGHDTYGKRPVNQAISRLRKQLGDDARNPRFIKTVDDIGFCMIATVTLLEEDDPRFPTTHG
jgi:DNA-binding winged helix-turn-helix (wHTH) protein